jgi:hypothetical protein
LEKEILRKTMPESMEVRTTTSEGWDGRRWLHHEATGEAFKAWMAKAADEVAKLTEKDRKAFRSEVAKKAAEARKANAEAKAKAEAEAAAAAFAKIADSVKDNVVLHDGIGDGENRSSRKFTDPRWSSIISWLAGYNGEIIEATEVPGLTGLVTDVSSVTYGTPLNERVTTSKLVLAVQVGNQKVLVNVRGALHRNVGYIRDERVAALRANLPLRALDVSDEKALVQWFTAAGLKLKG